MRKGGGKPKGSKFEREVCSKLSLWITKGEHKDALWRSSMSGGRATVHVKKGGTNRQAGDICAVAPEGHVLTDKFYIECKHYKSLDLGNFFLGRNGRLRKFWYKTVAQATKHNRNPMLIAKQNNVPALVLIRAGDLDVKDGKCALISAGVWTEVWQLDDLVAKPFQLPKPHIPGNIIASDEGITVIKAKPLDTVPIKPSEEL
jgi:hypothetical protein